MMRVSDGALVDIIKALEDRASALRIELDKIQRAIQAMTGTKTVTRSPARRTFRHTEATKRKLRLAQKRIWDAKRKRHLFGCCHLDWRRSSSTKSSVEKIIVQLKPKFLDVLLFHRVSF
jgi:hypothetical protein